jgi:uncharacterized coiled-coil protein SlyX
MHRFVLILATGMTLSACQQQPADTSALEARIAQLEARVQYQENVLVLMQGNARGHEKHLQRLDRALDDALLGIPNLRAQ